MLAFTLVTAGGAEDNTDDDEAADATEGRPRLRPLPRPAPDLRLLWLHKYPEAIRLTAAPREIAYKCL